MDVDQRQPHASGGKLAVPSPSAGDRRLDADDVPAAASRRPAGRYDAYLDGERRAGERYLGNTGDVVWLVSFAPIAPAELRAFIRGPSSTPELDHDLIGRAGARPGADGRGIRRDGVSELQPRDLRSPAGQRRVPAEPPDRLPLEPQADVSLGLDVPGAPSLGGRGRSGARDGRGANRRPFPPVGSGATSRS